MEKHHQIRFQLLLSNCGEPERMPDVSTTPRHSSEHLLITFPMEKQPKSSTGQRSSHAVGHQSQLLHDHATLFACFYSSWSCCTAFDVLSPPHLDKPSDPFRKEKAGSHLAGQRPRQRLTKPSCSVARPALTVHGCQQGGSYCRTCSKRDFYCMSSL
jgi:hypothetical protein